MNPADFIGQHALIELQTAHSREVRRPFSGVVTAFACLGANGGLARYELTIQSWLWWLDLRQDSFVFTDASVLDIVDSVLADYQAGPQGDLIRWRVEVADRSVYPLRSMTTQYHETDLQLLTRLLVEEGLCYYFEHAAEGHTLVITDDSTRCPANTRATIRFTQSSARLKEDSIDRWQVQHHLLPGRVQLRSWDYRTLSTLAVESVASDVSPLLTLQLEPGAYAYADRDHGQRLADTVLQSFNARRLVVQGQGTVRTVSPATTFTLTDHYQAGSDAHVVLSVWHVARNNVDVKLRANDAGVIAKLLPLNKLSSLSSLSLSPLPKGDDCKDAGGRATQGAVAEGQGEGVSRSAAKDGPTQGSAPTEEAEPVEHYRNDFAAIPAAVAYKPASNAHGKSIYAKPTALGTQTAIVVGQDEGVHTDRDHRVQIQYHWQRGTNSSSALAHPAEADNATAQSKKVSSQAMQMFPEKAASLAIGAIATAAFTTRSCKWCYAKLVNGEYEELPETTPVQISDRVKAGEPCPKSGIWAS